MKTFFITCALLFGTLTLLHSQDDVTYRMSLRKMFEVSGTEEVYKSAITQMFTMFRAQHDVPEEVWAGLQQEFLKSSMDDLVVMLAPVYKKHLTKSDLESLTAFYLTPVGQKFANKTPLIMEESMAIGQQWGMKITEDFQTNLKEYGY